MRIWRRLPACWICPVCWTGGWRRCQEESVSGSPSRARSTPAPTCCCSTSRSPPSTWRGGEEFSTRCSRSGTTLGRSEEHTSELQSQSNLVCRLLLEKKKKITESAQKSKQR